MTNYWNFKDAIPATNEEKLKELNYEVGMFYETCKQIEEEGGKNQFEMNYLVELLAIHTRVLIDFFYGIANPIHPNDLFAQSFLHDWESKKPAPTNTLNDAKNKADKQLAHLSLWRIKLKRDEKNNWNNFSLIKKDLDIVIKKFYNLLGYSDEELGAIKQRYSMPR